jgi:hypothetical protein
MKITNLEFSTKEKIRIYKQAVATLIKRGESREQAREIISSETPQNILRLALGFERRTRGGARENAGRPIKQQKPE